MKFPRMGGHPRTQSHPPESNGDLMITKSEQGETEKNQDEPSAQKSEDSD
jgi:hypothetical protein